MAQTLRVATFNTELQRKGPGILLRDILEGDDPQVLAVLETLHEVGADVVVLQAVDHDLHLSALNALADSLAARGLSYPHRFAAAPNAGQMTDLDLDGDGATGGAGDAQGYGRFYGEGSMALLSRHPIAVAEVRDFSDLLWRNLPGALLPTSDGAPFPSVEAQQVQRLSSHGHWIVPIDHPELGRVQMLTFHAGPPVFDGPEDRNGRRNHDEVIFWRHLLDGHFGDAPDGAFVILGDANLDPRRGDGRGAAIRALLSDPRLQDPLPDSTTVAWPQTGEMRVDYVLPSADWTVADAGVHPADSAASRHRLVWVDLKR